MRSQLVFLIIQSIHFCAMTSRKTHVDFETSSKFSGWRQIINEMSVPKKLLFFYFLDVFICYVEVFIKVSIQSVLVMKLEEDQRFILCLADTRHLRTSICK